MSFFNYLEVAYGCCLIGGGVQSWLVRVSKHPDTRDLSSKGRIVAGIALTAIGLTLTIAGLWLIRDSGWLA